MAPQHILPTVSYPTSVSLLARRVLARRIEIPWLNIAFVVVFAMIATMTSNYLSKRLSIFQGDTERVSDQNIPRRYSIFSMDGEILARRLRNRVNHRFVRATSSTARRINGRLRQTARLGIPLSTSERVPRPDTPWYDICNLIRSNEPNFALRPQPSILFSARFDHPAQFHTSNFPRRYHLPSNSIGGVLPWPATQHFPRAHISHSIDSATRVPHSTQIPPQATSPSPGGSYIVHVTVTSV